MRLGTAHAADHATLVGRRRCLQVPHHAAAAAKHGPTRPHPAAHPPVNRCSSRAAAPGASAGAAAAGSPVVVVGSAACCHAGGVGGGSPRLGRRGAPGRRLAAVSAGSEAHQPRAGAGAKARRAMRRGRALRAVRALHDLGTPRQAGNAGAHARPESSAPTALEAHRSLHIVGSCSVHMHACIGSVGAATLMAGRCRRTRCCFRGRKSTAMSSSSSMPRLDVVRHRRHATCNRFGHHPWPSPLRSPLLPVHAARRALSPPEPAPHVPCGHCCRHRRRRCRWPWPVTNHRVRTQVSRMSKLGQNFNAAGVGLFLQILGVSRRLPNTQCTCSFCEGWIVSSEARRGGLCTGVGWR